MNLSKRSYKQELLDGANIPFAEIRRNLQELDFINRWLGGHKITVAGFKELLERKKEISVCEIGCGGGDNLIAISKWCKKNGVNVTVTGIDIKPECIAFAKTRTNNFTSVQWLMSDYRDVVFDELPDIIFSSLFCHHFTNDALVGQLKWMKENCTKGFFINDLERNTVAYYSIKILSGIFSKSYLVKNDAPLSVARGFTKDELENICRLASISKVKITWKWAFRYLLVFKK